MCQVNFAAISAIPAGRKSALPDPAELRLGVGVWLPMLAVAPGAARALLMVLLTAGRADHVSIVARHRV
jgi:hypothetical protein